MGGTYVRVGSTNRRADADLIAELRRYSHRESFDQGPMPSLNSEALGFRAASESIAGFAARMRYCSAMSHSHSSRGKLCHFLRFAGANPRRDSRNQM